MNLLVMLFALEMGILSDQPIVLGYDTNYYADMQMRFEIAELIFVQADVITYFDDSDRYGFAPFQADYTFSFGVIIADWFEAGFLHTCSHDVFSSKYNNYDVFTGEKIYLKIKAEITLIGGKE
jgi:hypothetical protein